MSLEYKISKLQGELALKNAFLAASVSFGKGNKFSKEVQEQVETEIKKFCAARAENLEVSVDPAPTESLTPEDVSILKSLAETVRKKTNGTTTVNAKKEISISSKAKFGPADGEVRVPSGFGKRAQLMTTDNIHASQRSKVHAGMDVYVNELRPDGYVNLRTTEGMTFNVPKDDIEYQE